MRPAVGICAALETARWTVWEREAFLLSRAYVEALLRAGAAVYMIPPDAATAADPDAVLDRLDGLVLAGGADIDPSAYGAERHVETTHTTPRRDRFEIALARRAIERELPLLGICRGLQVLNVALGGTLLQDVATEHHAAGRLAHRQQETGLAADEVGHDVTIVAGTPFARLFAADTLGVNSFHHQAIAALAPSLVPAAFAPDGLIEAVDRPGSGFVAAVQWHPELMFKRHPEQLRPFKALVEVAVAHRLTAVAV